MNYQVVVLALIKQEKPEIGMDLQTVTKERTNINKNQVQRKVFFHISASVPIWIQYEFPASAHENDRLSK